MGIKESRQKCWDLRNCYYSNVPSRMEVLDKAIMDYLQPSDIFLDAGCGSTIPLLKKYCDRVLRAIGIDLCSPTVSVNGNINVIISKLEEIPVQTERVDLIVSHSVFEHLREPNRVFKELGRILKNGGKLVFTTPNKYYYSCLLSKAVPDWLKNIYFKTVFGEEDFDHFPLHYRANSTGAFRNLARESGLKLVKVQAIRHYPYYFMFSTIMFRLGMAYDKFITYFDLKWLQSNWLVVMEKAD